MWQTLRTKVHSMVRDLCNNSCFPFFACWNPYIFNKREYNHRLFACFRFSKVATQHTCQCKSDEVCKWNLYKNIYMISPSLFLSISRVWTEMCQVNKVMELAVDRVIWLDTKAYVMSSLYFRNENKRRWLYLMNVYWKSIDFSKQRKARNYRGQT